MESTRSAGSLAIAPGTYYAHRARARDPWGHSVKALRDAILRPAIELGWIILVGCTA